MLRPIRALSGLLAFVVGLVLAAMVLAGCGGQANRGITHAVRPTRPSRPIWCPMLQINPALSKPNSPRAGSFDTRVLLGRPEKTAEAESRHRGCSWRVVNRDGHGLTVTADASSTRVDADIDHGVVIAVGVY